MFLGRQKTALFGERWSYWIQKRKKIWWNDNLTTILWFCSKIELLLLQNYFRTKLTSSQRRQHITGYTRYNKMGTTSLWRMQPPQNKVVFWIIMLLRYWLFCFQIRYLFNWKPTHNTNASLKKKGKYLRHFHFMFKIQTSAGISHYSRYTNVSFHKEKGKNAFWREPTSTFLAGILHKKHFTKYRAPYFRKRLMFLDCKKKQTRGKPTRKLFVF